MMRAHAPEGAQRPRREWESSELEGWTMTTLAIASGAFIAPRRVARPRARLDRPRVRGVTVSSAMSASMVRKMGPGAMDF